MPRIIGIVRNENTATMATEKDFHITILTQTEIMQK